MVGDHLPWESCTCCCPQGHISLQKVLAKSHLLPTQVKHPDLTSISGSWR